MIVRIYGETINRWFTTNEKGRNVLVQKEVEYKEFDVDTLELVGMGSEDFSKDREKQDIGSGYVYGWDGEKRNNGGQRAFEYFGYISFRRCDRKALNTYLKNKYKNMELVQLRK